MTQSLKLTQSIIQKLTYEGRKVKNSYTAHIVWDTEVRGLGLRILPSGKKTFLVDYRIGGRRRRMVVGQYGQITLDQARRLARGKLAEVLNGIDPLEEKGRGGDTMKSLCSIFIEEHAKPKKKTWYEDQRRIDQYILPNFGRMRVQDVTRKNVIEFHNRLGAKYKTEANHNLALLSVMFEFAKKTELLPEEHSNPARGVEKFSERKRDRWVRPHELPALIEAIQGYSGVYVRSALWLYLLTGMRKRELLTATWEQVDLESAELRLSETKSGRTHTVPLSAPALDILRQLPRQADNPYVLPGQRTGKHLANIDRPWQQIRAAAGLNDLQIHDLRRTFASWIADSGKPLQVVSKLLNHSNLATTKEVYAHLSTNPLKEAVEDHGAKIVEIASLRKKERVS